MAHAKSPPETQSALAFVCIDELVEDLYCQGNGRPALDPTLMVKLLLLGYLSGVRN